MDIEFDCDFRFADAHVAIGARWIQDTWDQQFLPEVGTFVQEDLERNNKGKKTERSMQVPSLDPVFNLNSVSKRHTHTPM